MLDVDHLRQIRDRIGIPLVLHGGTGTTIATLLDAVRNGIARVNVELDIRRVYEVTVASEGAAAAQQAVLRRTRELLREHFRISGLSRELLAHQG